jgi:hypothetical protein
MQPSTVISSDHVHFKDPATEQTYGDPTQLDHKKPQAQLTGAFLEAYKYLIGKSVILTLNIGRVTHQQVLGAFKCDVLFYSKISGDMKNIVSNAIKYHIELGNPIPDDNTLGGPPKEVIDAQNKCKLKRSKLLEEANKALEIKMPQASPLSVVTMDFERAAKNTDAILLELQAEVTDGIRLLVRQFSDRLNAMIEIGYAGFVEQTSDTVCRYHFLRPTSTERHVHTLISALKTPLEVYASKKALPEHVKSFTRTIPKWLQPFLSVETGNLAQKDVIKAAGGCNISTTSSTTYEWNPAITFGPIALINWQRNTPDKKFITSYLGIVLSVGAFLLLVFFLLIIMLREIGLVINAIITIAIVVTLIVDKPFHNLLKRS